ncbi:PREDICTED: MND1-interacting protein 1-like isoform X1 [Lupinus angustifolius]|uniref:MND1-interacting protein 1-like isoform X1 n=2 Tax=Lupinus angustifolius TaxID=3871 RepID=UPI00092F9247|nr:PREDICTED: MND1-interacting protein 1-like isoform X1 [Lupinus angustifolius]XP_019421727.1 PREDICTED: MND1-interacting protein 1-like isoform X1 [Lupinus angustifolius]
MGFNSREKNMRSNRRAKPSSSSSSTAAAAAAPKPALDDPISKSSADSPQQNPNPNSGSDEADWSCCTEEQMEEFLVLKLEFIYNQAISKLVDLGYSEDIALKAVLSNGHCYGGMDLLDNILSNSLQALDSSKGDTKESNAVFSDLMQLEKYALTGLVCLLQQLRPNMSKGHALWCLLVSDLHIGKASTMEIPVPDIGYTDPDPDVLASSAAVASDASSHGSSGGTEINLKLQREIEFPKRFNLSPSMMSLLKKNAAMFAAGYRANSKRSQTLPAKDTSGSSIAMSNLESTAVSGDPIEKSSVGQCPDDQDIIKDLVSKLCDLSLREKGVVAKDQRDQVIINLLYRIKDLEKQVEERKEWAQQKAVQAARKLTSDMTELKTLRMAKEEVQRLKQGKQSIDDATMKKLSEMESGLRHASVEVDRANVAVRTLEQENAELKAEMEASKLSASETTKACKEVAKREKKLLKKLQTWEKQKAKLEKEIADEKVKILQTQEELDQIRQSQKNAEIKWKEEMEAKEKAVGLVEEVRRSKEADETNNKRRLEALRVRIEIDFQRYKDDVLRLEQELSRLQSCVKSPKLQSNASSGNKSKGPETETIAKLLQELENLEGFSEKNEVNGGRECIVCKKGEVSVVFLPCTHQVMCATCGDEYGRNSQAACPCCRVPIRQKIHVFGASS